MSSSELSPVICRLQLFIDSIGISVSSFADKCGLSKSNLSQTLGGRNKSITDVFINKVKAAYPNLNLTWLLTGNGHMDESQNIEFSEPQNTTSGCEVQSQQSENQREPQVTPHSPAQAYLFPNQETSPTEIAFHDEIANFGLTSEDYASLKSKDQASDKEYAHPIADRAHQTPSSNERKIQKVILLYTDNTFDYYVPE